MGVVSERVVVGLPPVHAFWLWCDTSRWPAFIEGFDHTLSLDSTWPQVGSKHVWQSVSGGRGRVTEQVTEQIPGERFVCQVAEQRLTAEQTLELTPEDERTLVRLELDYRLVHAGILGPLTDLLFVRRALSASLARTLRRYAIESAEQTSV